ncbi:MAG: hypothetical protein OXC40_02755 [Proteobacteria bacterium]|nr:hypothetical protein [Pseudomonadota bacterium]
MFVRCCLSSIKSSVLLVIITLCLGGCATIVRSSHQSVRVVDAPEKAKLMFQGKVVSLSQGSNVVTMKREVAPVVQVKCPGSTSPRNVTVGSSPGMWFIVGNFFSWSIPGYLVDYFTGKGWNIDSPIQLSSYCS